MNRRREPVISRRTFLKRGSVLGAAAAGMAGGLSGCFLGAHKAVRSYTLGALSAVLTPINNGLSRKFSITLKGVGEEVVWTDSASPCGSDNESIREFVDFTWPSAFADSPPNGMLTGYRPGKKDTLGFRVVIQHLDWAAESGMLTGIVQSFDDWWEDEESFIRGDAVTIEEVTLHLLPPLVDEKDPEHLLVHCADAVQWAGASLSLQGISAYANWLYNGSTRLGGREPVEELVATWSERYGNTSVEAWLWQKNAEGIPAVHHLSVLSAQYFPDQDLLTFSVKELKSFREKLVAGAATFFMDGGTVSDRADTVIMEMRFTDDHFWVIREGNRFRMGLTDYAQSRIGDVVFIEVYRQSDAFARDAAFAEMHSVKTRTDLYIPLNASAVVNNTLLDDMPYLINLDPYGDGWIITAVCDDFSPMADMMTLDQYQAYIEQLSE